MPKVKLSPINNQQKFKKFISISKAAKILHVSPDTLRNWEKEGKLIPIRTKGGARRYSSSELLSLRKEINPFPARRKGLLTVKQAALALNISTDTIRSWDQKGLIETQRTKGGARRFTRAEIIRLQKELGVKPVETDKAINLTPTLPAGRQDFVPDVHKFRIGYSKIILITTILFELIILTGLTILVPSIDNSQAEEVKKQINAIAKSLESLQSGVLGIQTQFLASDSAIPQNEIVEKVIQIDCKSCLTEDSNYISAIATSDDSISLNPDGKKINLSINLDHPNSWESTQTFSAIHSSSAQFSELKVTEKLSSDKLLVAEDIQISNQLKVFGETVLANTKVVGDLTVDGMLSIENGSEINVIGGLLFLQKSPLAGGLDIMNGLVRIDSEGNLRAQTVTVAEFKVVAGKISGSATLQSGQSFIEVENPLVKSNSRILITPTSETSLILAVTQKEAGNFFTVSTSKAAEQDIDFDYFLINET